MSGGIPDSKHIRKKMIDAGETVTGVAEKIGVSRRYVTAVIRGERIGTKVRKGLCRRLGMRMDRAFPRRGFEGPRIRGSE